MKGRILILGAGGRLGFAAAIAFRDAGWAVTSLVRPGKIRFAARGTEIVQAVTRDEAIKAGEGCTLVLNALNPHIAEWDKNALAHGYAGIAVAEANGATLLYPGNMYVYGRDMPSVVDETTPMNPCTRKGAMRLEIERRIEEACERGMRAIVLRSGDFYGSGTGSWFDLVMVRELAKQRITYPGPRHVRHEWAYLPDLVATWVKLVEHRERFAPFETFGFPGHSVTGAEMIDAVEKATGAVFSIRTMSWWMLKTFGRMLKLGRELAELEYLWRTPHAINGDKLRGAIGEVPHTPLHRAVGNSLRELGFKL